MASGKLGFSTHGDTPGQTLPFQDLGDQKMFEGSNVCYCLHTFNLVPELFFTSNFVLDGFVSF